MPSMMGFRVFDLALSPSGIPFPRDPWLAPSLPSGFCLDITFSERPSWRKDNFLFFPSCFMFLHSTEHYLFVQSLCLFSGGHFQEDRLLATFFGSLLHRMPDIWLVFDKICGTHEQIKQHWDLYSHFKGQENGGPEGGPSTHH